MSKLKFSINAESENSTKTIVKARGFKIIIDEPENLGGTNDGANPVEYVIGALSGCLSVVGHLVAREMNFKLNGIRFDIEGELDPSKFMGKDMNKRAGYENINVTVYPDTDADENTLNEWIKVVESRCPVSDNIMHETPINISIG